MFVRERDNKSENTWQHGFLKHVGKDFCNGGTCGRDLKSEEASYEDVRGKTAPGAWKGKGAGGRT